MGCNAKLVLKDNNTKNFVTSIVGNRTGTRANSGQYSDDLAKNIFEFICKCCRMGARSSWYNL